jgi:hypothetical protein
MQSDTALDEEREALLRQMRRMVWLFVTGEDRREDFTLHFGPSDRERSSDVVVTPLGDHLEIKVGRRVTRRRSQAVQRLAEFAANATLRIEPVS